MPRPKKIALPVRADRESCSRALASRRAHPPRRRDCRPPVRDSRVPAPLSARRHAAGLGAPLPQRRLRGAGAATAARPRTIPHHHAAARRSHRTSQAREPASHRHYTAARTGYVVRPKRAGHLRLHPVSLPQAAWTHRAPTARSPGAQEVRSRIRQPDLAVGHALWSLCPAPRRRQDAGPAAMPSSTTPAGSSRTLSSMPAKVWTFAWTACAKPLRPAVSR